MQQVNGPSLHLAKIYIITISAEHVYNNTYVVYDGVYIRHLDNNERLKNIKNNNNNKIKREQEKLARVIITYTL